MNAMWNPDLPQKPTGTFRNPGFPDTNFPPRLSSPESRRPRDPRGPETLPESDSRRMISSDFGYCLSQALSLTLRLVTEKIPTAVLHERSRITDAAGRDSWIRAQSSTHLIPRLSGDTTGGDKGWILARNHLRCGSAPSRSLGTLTGRHQSPARTSEHGGTSKFYRGPRAVT